MNFLKIIIFIILGYFLTILFFYLSSQLIVYHFVKYLCLLFFFSVYIWSLSVWALLNQIATGVQFLQHFALVEILNMSCLLGVDSLSSYFVLLTTFIFIVCSLLCLKDSIIAPLIYILAGIEILLILTFTALDLFFFSCFFEGLLMLIFILILVYGSRVRRIKALTYFVIYTIVGSGFLFFALLILYYELQTFTFALFILPVNLLQSYLILLGSLFIVFAIKLPMMPLHLLLTEAHVEAPTIGSIILASLLLKVGGYGLLRFLIFPYEGINFFKYIILVIALYSIIFSSWEALRQSDLKKIIAYSSIAHINVGVVGLSSMNVFGIVGHLILIISHGFISAGLFILVGIIYERTHSRILYYHKGVLIIIPLFSVYLMWFILSNVGFPGTSGFLVELLIIISLGATFFLIALLFLNIGVFLCFIYCVYIITTLLFGSVPTWIKSFNELSRGDHLLLVILFSGNMLVGLNSSMFFKLINWLI